MAFAFNESTIITVPNVNRQYKAFKESEHRANNKLIIEVAAIHVGLTSNFNMYGKSALENALSSWVSPYPRPIILNHDQFSDTIGRVMASRMMTESDGTDYVRLQAGITDPLAIERVLDERYLTGSVGGGANVAKCSICEIDWASDEAMAGNKLPCRHRRGAVYEGKLAYFDLQEIKFKEYSFVNIPADEHSGVRSKTTASAKNETADSDWTHNVRMYSLDMNKPCVVEMGESEGFNLLESMRKKEAQATYTNLKGTFLSTSAYDYKEFDDENGESENSANTNTNDLVQDMNNLLHHNLMNISHKENNMATNAAEEIETNEEEDILAVSEQLATDLANVKADEVAENEEKISADESVEAADELSENSDEEIDPADDEEETEEEEAVKDSQDAQLVTSDDVAEESADEQATESETASAEGSPPEAQENGTPDVENDPTRNSAEMDTLKAENENLKSKVEKLSKALHGMLVERVVEAKIARGLVEAENRADMIAEHSTRTASSLADSLKDTYALPTQKSEKIIPTVEQKTGVLGDEENVTNADNVDVVQEREVDPAAFLENHLYKLLNGNIYESVS